MPTRRRRSFPAVGDDQNSLPTRWSISKRAVTSQPPSRTARSARRARSRGRPAWIRPSPAGSSVGVSAAGAARRGGSGRAGGGAAGAAAAGSEARGGAGGGPAGVDAARAGAALACGVARLSVGRAWAAAWADDADAVDRRGATTRCEHREPEPRPRGTSAASWRARSTVSVDRRDLAGLGHHRLRLRARQAAPRSSTRTTTSPARATGGRSPPGRRSAPPGCRAARDRSARRS